MQGLDLVSISWWSARCLSAAVGTKERIRGEPANKAATAATKSAKLNVLKWVVILIRVLPFSDYISRTKGPVICTNCATPLFRQAYATGDVCRLPHLRPSFKVISLYGSLSGRVESLVSSLRGRIPSEYGSDDLFRGHYGSNDYHRGEPPQLHEITSVIERGLRCFAREGHLDHCTEDAKSLSLFLSGT